MDKKRLLELAGITLNENFQDPDVNRAVDELARAIIGSDLVGDRADFAGSDDAGDLAMDVGGAVLMAVEQRLKRLRGGQRG